MKKMIITNNNLVHDKYNEKMDTIYLEGDSYLEVLKFTRDKIHEGYKLLTHPLSGSVKPNETPFKTTAIELNKGKLDLESLQIIEESIMVANKFIKEKKTPNWNPKILDDFRIIDLYLIDGAIESMDQFY
ncbi:hypothetical protein SAMN02194393_02869 [Maledivibacter halophilus]|uniref:GrdX protein n=2 Tax=Maledivibacter halophilus TaxID=36842 RepID=A0A1T5LHN9_9FIRM|nr:hypothetical protein SAMN02194393_02869 [Maledivibacter halophilus]